MLSVADATVADVAVADAAMQLETDSPTVAVNVTFPEKAPHAFA